MFLFKRFKELFSKDYWKKAKFHKVSNSIGFFLFWMLIFAFVASISTVIFSNRLANSLVEDFRRDFVDFEIRMTDGVLSTRNIPDPFVFSEFLNSKDANNVLGLEEEIIEEFKKGFKEGFNDELEVNGQNFEAEDVEFVLDTKGELGISVDTVDQSKLGFYFLAEEFIVTDPTGLEESERLAVESYENNDDFEFNKEYLISIWDKYSRSLSWLLFGISFGVFVFMFMFVRLITAFVWAFVVWAVGSLMNYKFDYFEAYGVALTYLVPITLIELLIMFTLGWIPLSTIGLIILFAIVHGVSANSELKGNSKPEVLEQKK